MDEIRIRKQIHRQLSEQLKLAQTELQDATTASQPETIEERVARCAAIARDMHVNERALLKVMGN
jgi:hypothetical protein